MTFVIFFLPLFFCFGLLVDTLTAGDEIVFGRADLGLSVEDRAERLAANVFHHPYRGGRDTMRRRGLDIPRCQHCITTPPGTQARKGERANCPFVEANCPLFCSSLLLPKLSSTRTRPRLCVKDRCCLVQEIPSTGTALFMSAATGGIVFSVSRILMVQLPAFKDAAGGGKIKTWTDLWRSAGFFAQSHHTSALKRAGR